MSLKVSALRSPGGFFLVDTVWWYCSVEVYRKRFRYKKNSAKSPRGGLLLVVFVPGGKSQEGGRVQ